MLRRHAAERRSSRPVRAAFVLLGLAALTSYFVHHALHGRHGVENRKRLEARAALISTETARLEATRARLLRDVTLLRPEIADADLVEEIARDVLGYVRPGDVILPVKPANASRS